MKKQECIDEIRETMEEIEKIFTKFQHKRIYRLPENFDTLPANEIRKSVTALRKIVKEQFSEVRRIFRMQPADEWDIYIECPILLGNHHAMTAMHKALKKLDRAFRDCKVGVFDRKSYAKKKAVKK